MPVQLHNAPNYVLVVALGIVTEAQIIQTFDEILNRLDEQALYVVMEITEMIYQPDVVFADEVNHARLAFLAHPNLVSVVYILATNHPLRETFMNAIGDLGYIHKLHFALNEENAHSLFDT